MATLSAGDMAPLFALPATGGREVSLESFRGKIVVLFLYPRDDTPGCTKEAIGFTEFQDQFTAAGAVIFGLSRDALKTHEKFVAKHNLGMDLLSAETHEVINAYGAWVEKNMYGKKSMGIERSTFLIESNGRIRQIWRKVKVPGHVEEVLAAVHNL